MKRKLICWLPLLLLIGCSQPTYRTTSLTPDKRAELLLNLKSATPFPKCYLHKEKWTFDS